MFDTVSPREPEFHLILFCDLIGSSDVAAEVPQSRFAQILTYYFQCCDLSRQHLMEFFSVRRPGDQEIAERPARWEEAFSNRSKFIGDEFMLLVPVPDEENLGFEITSALVFALNLKIYWHLCDYNYARIQDGKFPRDISVGMNADRVSPIEFGGSTRRLEFVGYPIHIAKRIESITRAGNSSLVFLSQHCAMYYKYHRQKRIQEIEKMGLKPYLMDALGFHPFDSVSLKGIVGATFVTEMRPQFFYDDLDMTSVLDRLHDIALGETEEQDLILKKMFDDFTDFWAGQESLFSKLQEQISNDLIRFLKNLARCAMSTSNAWFEFEMYYIACIGTYAFRKWTQREPDKAVRAKLDHFRVYCKKRAQFIQ
ncbi:hypothetical protein HOF92_14950 [bacterium]|jgi:class 3 adenylate cyclase|nr:hypothetical protein [bacterium]